MLVLSNEQVMDTPIAYLQKRFNDTFIVHPTKGLIHVIRLDGGGRVFYKSYDSLFSALYPQVVKEQWMYIKDFSVKEAVPIDFLGYVNTPFGVVRIEDKAERQWVWGFCHHRFKVRGANDKVTPEILAYCCFNPQMYYEQFVRGTGIAIGTNYLLQADGMVHARFGYTVAQVNPNTLEIEKILISTFEDEFMEDWNKLWQL